MVCIANYRDVRWSAHLGFSVGPRGVDGRADRFMLYFVNTGTQIGLRIRAKADTLLFRFDDGVRTQFTFAYVSTSVTNTLYRIFNMIPSILVRVSLLHAYVQKLI